MVLSQRNSGKYLSKEWHDKRAQALVDRTRFSDAELEWLEVGENEGRGKLDRDNFLAETQPFGESVYYGVTKVKRYDVRDRPEAGGIE